MNWTIRITILAALIATVGLTIHPRIPGTDTPTSPANHLWPSLIPSAFANEEAAETATGNLPEANRLIRETLLVAGERTDGHSIVVGDRGSIFIRTDGTPGWFAGTTPTHRLLTSVTSPDGKEAWAVGHDAIVLHSTDGGRTWAEQFSAPDEEAPLFDVWFADHKRGMATGAYGLIIETSDGGENWTQRSISEDGPHHYSICESPAGSLYVAGEFGSIFRSGDRGETWNELSSPYGGTYFGALALRDGAILIFGLRGNLFRSEDHGETWTKLETGTSGSLLGGSQLEDGRVIIVGLNGLTLESNDGESFTLSSRKDRVGHSAVLETSDRVLLLGEGGVKGLEQ